MLSVSAVIPTHERADLLERALRSLFRVRLPEGTSFETIVVANACTDGTHDLVAEIARGAPHPIRLAEEPIPNLNRARNRGVAESRGEVVALLDDDVLVSDTWLAALVEAFDTQPVDIVAGRVELWWEVVERPAWMSDHAARLLSCTSLGEEPCEVHSPRHVVGANFAFRRELFESLGGFVEGLDRTGQDLLGGGDTEFVARALRQHRRVLYEPAMAVKHWVPPHRATTEYLERVARGRGRTLVALTELAGQPRLPVVLGGLGVALRGALAGMMAHLRRSPSRRLDARLFRLRGQATFLSGVQRWMLRRGALPIASNAQGSGVPPGSSPRAGPAQ
jgi:glucosyl-dolichyl phosphate glucuronosyltransferase